MKRVRLRTERNCSSEAVDRPFLEKAKRAQALKGKLIVPPTDIPGIGRFAVVTDVQGAAFAVFKGSM